MNFILLLALVSSAALGADDAIKWRSKGLTLVPQDNVINLTTAVEIRQGDAVVYADTAQIFFQRSAKQAWRDAITKVVLRGRVRFSFGQGTAKVRGSSARAELLPQESITLSGDAQVTRGGNVLRGTSIIYYLHTGWIKVSEAEGVIQLEQQ